jgi:hypothetical protein
MKLIQAGATNLIKMQNPTIYKYKKHTNKQKQTNKQSKI